MTLSRTSAIAIAQQSTASARSPPSSRSSSGSGKAKSKPRAGSIKLKSKSKSNRLITKNNNKAIQPQSSKKSKTEKDQGLTDSLAICLVGFSSYRMYDSEYEEEVRKQAVMQVSLGLFWVYKTDSVPWLMTTCRRCCLTPPCGKSGKLLRLL